MTAPTAEGSAPAPTPGARGSSAPALLAVSALFVVSGATGLAYEVVWFKRFTQVWGASSLATAAVVACFLFGLGLGARLFGRLADRTRKPLLVYAACELGIAVLAVAAHFAVGALLPISAWAYGALGDSPVLFALVRFAVTFLVLGPPTVLMGATLPLLVRQLTAAGATPGIATAWLYFANSLGAALGAWAAGFHLLPVLGLVRTNALVAAVNVLVALLAWGLVREVPEARPEPRADAGDREGSGRWLARRLLVAAFLTGAASIGLQMVWTRSLAVLVGGTTYAFTAIVSVFILGIAAGSLAYRMVVRETTPSAVVIGVACLGIAVTTLVGHVLQVPIAALVGQVRELRADLGMNAFVCVAASAAIEGGPTFFMGVLFPALVAHAGAGRQRAGRTVGRLYAWNTVGSILGATVTGVLLLPALGSYGTVLLALCAYVAVVFVLFPPTPRELHPVPLSLGAAVAAVVLGGGALAAPDELDRKIVNMGSYLYGPGIFRDARESELLLFREAPTANIMVLALDGTERPDVPIDRLVNIRTNGKVDGGNAADVRTQAGTGLLPRLLRPDASEVLVIGFGTGTTAGASLLFEGTRVDCCEIEEAVVDASPFFHDVNYRPELSTRYRTILEDGRNHVQSTDSTYDLVLSEPSNPWIAGIANLYTREFYETVRGRLKPGGMLGQWIQTYQFSAAEFSLIVNTIRAVFPHTVLLRIDDSDLMMLASATPILPDRATADRAQERVDATPAVGGALAELFGTSDVRVLFLRHLALDGEGLERFVRSETQTAINTDANLRLEFDAPLRLFTTPTRAEHVITGVLGALDMTHYHRLVSSMGWTRSSLEALYWLRAYFANHGDVAKLVGIADLAEVYSPDVPAFLGDVLQFRPPDDPSELAVGLRRLGRFSVPELRRVADGYREAGDAVRAALALEELARLAPYSAGVYAALTVVYDRLGRVEEADRAAERAEELDPANELIMGMVERRRELRSGAEPGTGVPAAPGE